jgi:hypothetical protein
MTKRNFETEAFFSDGIKEIKISLAWGAFFDEK